MLSQESKILKALWTMPGLKKFLKPHGASVMEKKAGDLVEFAVHVIVKSFLV